MKIKVETRVESCCLWWGQLPCYYVPLAQLTPLICPWHKSSRLQVCHFPGNISSIAYISCGPRFSNCPPVTQAESFSPPKRMRTPPPLLNLAAALKTCTVALPCTKPAPPPLLPPPPPGSRTDAGQGFVSRTAEQPWPCSGLDPPSYPTLYTRLLLSSVRIPQAPTCLQETREPRLKTVSACCPASTLWRYVMWVHISPNVLKKQRPIIMDHT